MYHIVVTITRGAASAVGHTLVVTFQALMGMIRRVADLNDQPKLFLSRSSSICNDLADDGS
jgi:hypothetical protein